MARGPSYPGIGLDQAVGLARELHSAEGRNAIPAHVAVKAFGHEAMSGSARRKVAALRYYGLLEDVADEVRLSELAMQILVPHDDEERDRSLRRAALKPDIFREVQDRYGENSDAAIRAFLLRDKSFNESGIDTFIEAFRATQEYASLNEAPPKPSVSEGETDNIFDVGDYVQWESQGVLQFPTPKRVTGFSRDGTTVFVEGEKGGFPRDQVEKVEAPANQPPPVGSIGPPAGQGRTSMTSGTQETLRNLTIPLPGERIAILSAPVGLTEKDHGQLLKYLELMKDSLVTDKPDDSEDE